MGLEGEDGVGALDHLAVADVNAVEGADRDLARPGLGVGELGHFHRHEPRTFASSKASARASASASGIGCASAASSAVNGPIAVRRSSSQ